MKKFFIKDMANMVEKDIATEFLLRNVKLSIADGRRWQDLTLSDKSGICLLYTSLLIIRIGIANLCVPITALRFGRFIGKMFW